MVLKQKKIAAKTLALSLTSLALGTLPFHGFSEDLVQVYQQALKSDPSLQSAKATYAAAKLSVPIARAGLLPSISVTANDSINKNNRQDFRYNSNGYTASLTQPIIDIASWKGLGQAHTQVKQAAIQYAQAEENLITDTTKRYFKVLEAKAKLKYSQKYLAQLKQQLEQTEQMYKVGLKAYTDVQTSKSEYESAKANFVSAQNNVQNALESLQELTGQPIKSVAELKEQFPLLKPNPTQPQKWANAAGRWNLQLQNDLLSAQIDKENIALARAGGSGAPGYYPTVNVQLQNEYGSSHSSGSASSSTTNSASVNASWNVFNGGITYYTVKQARYTYLASVEQANTTRRQVLSQTEQAYLNVLSDISQIQALKQAIISGEASLKASRAAYQVGTRTIVDLLKEESNLFDIQQQYAEATYNYINDSIQLKQVSGVLTGKDVTAVNQWLQAQPGASSS